LFFDLRHPAIADTENRPRYFHFLLELSKQ
jgi:hypothetical protein